jgi:hypothetical protein
MTDGAVPTPRVAETLADWRDAERARDVAASEREVAAEKAGSVERVEEAVAQVVADAETTARAAEQAERSAREAVAAVAEVSESTQEELDRAAAAEATAKAATEAARARHRAAQEAAMARYREGGRPSPGAARDEGGARADEVSEPREAG